MARNGKVPIILLLILIELFLFINADWVYGTYSVIAKNIIFIEMMLTTVLLVFVKKLPEEMLSTQGISSKGSPIRNFISIFLVSTILLGLVPVTWLSGKVFGVLTGGIVASAGFMLLHSVVIAFNEELVFRGILPQFIKGPKFLNGLFTSMIFGVFHIATKSGNILSLIALTALGQLFYFISEKKGIMGSTALHFVWNLKAMGVLNVLLGF